MENGGGSLEQAVDVTAPLWEEWAAAEILSMRFERCPDVDEHVLIGPLDAAFHPCGDAFGVLANDIQAVQDSLSKLILFAGDGGENGDFCNQLFLPRFLSE
jgi:hypothetical protein